MGGYIFSHKIRLRPRVLKQFIPKKVIEKILLYDHNVICQDVFKKTQLDRRWKGKKKPLEPIPRGHNKEAWKEENIAQKKAIKQQDATQVMVIAKRIKSVMISSFVWIDTCKNHAIFYKGGKW